MIEEMKEKKKKFLLSDKFKKYLIEAAVFLAGAVLIFNTYVELKTESQKVEGIDRTGQAISVDKLADLRLRYKTIKKDLNERLPVLYYAGLYGNWPLVDYEAFAIDEDIVQANASTLATYAQFDKFRESYVKPLHKVAKDQDVEGFKDSFDKMLNACNSCHNSTDVPYIQVTVPHKAELNPEVEPASQ